MKDTSISIESSPCSIEQTFPSLTRPSISIERFPASIIVPLISIVCSFTSIVRPFTSIARPRASIEAPSFLHGRLSRVGNAPPAHEKCPSILIDVTFTPIKEKPSHVCQHRADQRISFDRRAQGLRPANDVVEP
jgi:hypothetical protein